MKSCRVDYPECEFAVQLQEVGVRANDGVDLLPNGEVEDGDVLWIPAMGAGRRNLVVGQGVMEIFGDYGILLFRVRRNRGCASWVMSSSIR